MRVRRVSRRVLWFVSVLTLVVAVVAAGLAFYSTTIENQIAANEESFQRFISDADGQLKEINERKEQERKEAAARKAAEEARVATALTPQSGPPPACRISSARSDPTRIDVLVNKKHCVMPLDFTPPNLVTSYGATLSSSAIDDFNKMYRDAAAAGQGFYVTSSYRSYTTQVATYAHWVSVSGKDGADTYSARPGYSEHQLGLVVDVAANGCVLDCFGSTSQYIWLKENAARYGFIQRYSKGHEHITGYSSEEWHFRYIGSTAALDMKSKDIATLEEYWGMKGGDYY